GRGAAPILPLLGSSACWRVDPHGRRKGRCLWPLANEALRVPAVDPVEYGVACVTDRFCLAVVDGRGGHESDAAVTVIVVVPVEERSRERAAVFERAEAIGEFWAVLERLELCLREGVVVCDVRSGVGRCHS